MNLLEGAPTARGLRVALVVARFNDFVTDRLQAGAVEALAGAGVAAEDVTILKVPGSFEISLAARRAAETGRFDAIVCLGCDETYGVSKRSKSKYAACPNCEQENKIPKGWY